jgi:hypothetical protein
VRAILPHMGHKVKIAPVRQRFWDNDLHTTVIRTVGHRAVCECGERSKVKRRKGELRTWQRDHRAQVK